MDKGWANNVGPNLYEIINRNLGVVSGFAYSGALKEKGGAWGYPELDAFIAKPKKWLPRTKMAFAGIKKPEQRASLILYLRSLSESPAPLPATVTTRSPPTPPSSRGSPKPCAGTDTRSS